MYEKLLEQKEDIKEQILNNDSFFYSISSEEVFQNLERTVIQKPALGRKHLKERNDYIQSFLFNERHLCVTSIFPSLSQ